LKQLNKEWIMKKSLVTLIGVASLGTALLAFAASGPAFAQSGDMEGMNMQGMDMKSCMDMKGMDMKACKDMMNGMDSDQKAQGRSRNGAVHKTSAVVTAVDPVKGTVTLAHEPVKSLKWPAMSMAFTVKDKTLFDKLTVGKKVDVEFTQQGSDYVVTTVK
jgi:Cu(I)/Ag(I) efflux system protein CusF